MSSRFREYLAAAVIAARRAGTIIVRDLGSLSGSDIEQKQAADFVTKVDRRSEAAIIQTVRESFPDHTFLAEETLKEPPGGYRWIIDPLDGTTNYIHGFPAFCVSIALENDGRLILGVVFDPLRDELFHAVQGGGAYLNNRRIRVSSGRSVSEALVATGFPFRKKDSLDQYLTLFRGVFSRVSDIRRAGSAALDLSYVACGRLDGFFERGLGPWDIAAGSLLIAEAGGVISYMDGGTGFLYSGEVVAGNDSVHRMLLDVMRGAPGPAPAR